MEYKDKKFKLFNKVFTIKYVDTCPEEYLEEGKFFNGLTVYGDKTIYIITKDIHGKPISKSEMDETLYHELVHVMLDEGQYSGYSEDEPLVEWMAKCIFSLKNSKVL